ncbi:MAG: nuclear transport factor 2 family protein [Calditrichaceae bacterium]|nr:nuclear transport factor 2 family protein [Calditrichaceae bacterium]
MTNKMDEKTIINEIDQILDDLSASYELLDVERSFSFFSDDPDFFMIGSDGLIYDHETFYMANKMYFNECSKFELITYFKDIKVLTNTLVLVTWHYKAIATRFTGGREIFDPAGATFLFRKIDGQWKVVNYQESAQAPK